jgi:hypothetical protein
MESELGWKYFKLKKKSDQSVIYDASGEAESIGGWLKKCLSKTTLEMGLSEEDVYWEEYFLNS